MAIVWEWLRRTTITNVVMQMKRIHVAYVLVQTNVSTVMEIHSAQQRVMNVTFVAEAKRTMNPTQTKIVQEFVLEQRDPMTAISVVEEQQLMNSTRIRIVEACVLDPPLQMHAEIVEETVLDVQIALVCQMEMPKWICVINAMETTRLAVERMETVTIEERAYLTMGDHVCVI
jgi:hypothetical protein